MTLVRGPRELVSGRSAGQCGESGLTVDRRREVVNPIQMKHGLLLVLGLDHEI